MEQLRLFDQLLDGLASNDSQADAIEAFVLTHSGYLELADRLLVTTIQEAFCQSRGGRMFSNSRSDEAWTWIEEDLSEGRCNPFSFRNCCLAAGVDPEELQERLFLMRHQTGFGF